MALPTSTNNVTVRKLSSTLQALWNKITTALGGKADKVTSATNNNFAALDANGNLKDSGKKAGDFATSAQGTKADSAIQGIKLNGTAQTPDDNKIVDITKSGLGLGNVTNDAQVKRSEMGVANGVATLDSSGKIPTSQIPGSYDDVREGYYYNGEFYTDAAHTNQMAHTIDIVYVDIPNNKTYRWSGTQYVVIGSDLALGETSSTAYRGDRGKTAYDHSQLTSGNPHNVSKSDVGLGSVVNTGDSATPVSGGTTKFTTGGAYTELAKKVDKETGKGLSTNDYTTTEKNKLAGISANAKKVESSTTNGNIKIDGTETTVYTHPTTSGNKHIPSGGSSGQFLGWDSDGTAKWVSNPANAVTPQGLGFGYAASTTNSSAAFSAAVTGFSLKQNGIVVVKFSAAVPASATLNVTSTGNKTIKWKGNSLAGGEIQSGDTCTFSYDGTNWNLISVDRSVMEMTDTEVTDLVDALT